MSLRRGQTCVTAAKGKCCAWHMGLNESKTQMSIQKAHSQLKKGAFWAMASARFTYVEETGIKSVSCKANRRPERSDVGFGQRINKPAAGPRVGAVPGRPLCTQEGRTHGRKQHAEASRNVSTVSTRHLPHLPTPSACHCFNRMYVRVCVCVLNCKSVYVCVCVRVCLWQPACNL